MKLVIPLQELLAFSEAFHSGLESGDKVVLIGDMGAGKTTFVSALCRSMGIEDVSSPTFTLVNRYDAKPLTVYHMDLYRLESEADLIVLGLQDVFERPNSLFFVEWGEKILGELEGHVIRMDWEYKSEESRSVELTFSSSDLSDRLSHKLSAWQV